jgi:hypothetical protein
MADVTVTKTSVRPLENANINSRHTAGEALTLGDAVYLKSDGKWWQTDASVAGTASDVLIGVVVAGSSSPDTTNDGDVAAGELIDVVVWGGVEGFSSLTPGAILYLSDNAGLIADAVGTVTRRIGYADRASNIQVVQS